MSNSGARRDGSRYRVFDLGGVRASELKSKCVNQLKKQLTAPDFRRKAGDQLQDTKYHVKQRRKKRLIKISSFVSQHIGIEIKMCKSAQKAIDSTGFSQKG